MRRSIIPESVLANLQGDGSLIAQIIDAIGAKAWMEFYEELDPVARHILQHDWALWARPAQRRPPDPWHVWVIMAGRGFGKTRPGAETVNEWAAELHEQYGQGHIALIGKDPEDIRKVMIEGESGILACAPPWFKPLYEPSKKQLTWPNGVKASVYSSEEPEQLRGPQHHKLWGDEICKWKKAQEVWDMAAFGLRLGYNPQALLTTTPKPIQVLMDILKDAGTIVTGGNTYENQANLSEVFLQRMKRKYENTRLGKQELYAQMLTDTPGALWTRDMIEACRVDKAPDDMITIVIGVDPAVTDPKDMSKEDAETIAETGIVAVGKGSDGHGYVLHDFSDFMSPSTWGTKAVIHYEALKADKIVGEVNNGGDLVEFLVKVCAKEQGYDVNFEKVHASRGKRVRAEPVSALYEQKRMHHVGMHDELEDQMCTWVPGMKSPDRMDAMVWAATKAMLLSPDDLILQ